MRARAVDVLMVEDNLNDVKLTMKALTKNDFKINMKHVADGEEAVDYIFCRNAYSSRKSKDLPSLILMDLKLPKMNGLEVIKILKNDERTNAIPIVVLTSSNQDSDISECYKLGVNSYIVKPVDFNKFIDSVTKLGIYWLLLNEYPG